MKMNQFQSEILIATHDARRERVRLEPAFNSGAAGTVHHIVGDPSRVVKLYNPDILKKDGKVYEAKINAMLGHVPSLPVPPKVPDSPVEGDIIQIAWPLAIARNKAGFAGFVMPAIEVQHTIELEFVMQAKQARAHNLRSDLGSRLLLAHNLAAVVHGIHAQGHAVVDMKPVNMRFYKHELYMAVLDCDGFSISGFPAHQVTRDYLAPEYQGMQAITKPELQDRFALALIIFRLLNFGIHPYAGVPQVHGVPDEIELRIRDGLYAYGSRANARISPVPGSAHACLPGGLRQMFDMAFGRVPSLRPSALDWAQALAQHASVPGSKPESCGAGHLRFPGMPCGNCLREQITQGALARKPATAGGRKKTQASPGTFIPASPSSGSAAQSPPSPKASTAISGMDILLFTGVVALVALAVGWITHRFDYPGIGLTVFGVILIAAAVRKAKTYPFGLVIGLIVLAMGSKYAWHALFGDEAGSTPPASAAVASVAPKPPEPRSDSMAPPQPVLEHTQPTAKANPDRATVSGESWVVQLGIYRDQANVRNLTEKLERLGYDFSIELLPGSDGSNRTAVRAGPFPTGELAERARERIRQIGVNGIIAMQNGPPPASQLRAGPEEQGNGKDPIPAGRALSAGEQSGRGASGREIASTDQTGQASGEELQQTASRPVPIDPRIRCAKKDNFISRGLCESRACQKPEYSGHPYCENYRQQAGSQ